MDQGLPLSDQIEGALHPSNSGLYYGHEEAVLTLSDVLQSGRLHHGWIFSGPLGVGKATLAYHFARVLLDKEPDSLKGDHGLLTRSEAIKSEKTGRLIAQFAHPDMRILRRAFDRKTKKFFSKIRIDEMRALKDMLHTTASMGGRRVVLIDRAEDMNEASSNALLKVLEEPPMDTIFILITNSIGQIPITIRSRCRLLKFHELGTDAFHQILSQQFSLKGEEAPKGLFDEELVHLSHGSVRIGFELLDGNGLRFYQSLCKLFEGLPALDGRQLEQFIDGVLRDKTGQDYKGALEMMADLLHRLIKGKVAGFPLSNREKRLSEKLISHGSVEQWLSLWDTLLQNSLMVDQYNLDKKTHLLTSFFHLRDIVRSF